MSRIVYGFQISCMALGLSGGMVGADQRVGTVQVTLDDAMTATFEKLEAEWVKESYSYLLSSNLGDALRHPAYRKLVELGRPIAPLVVQRIRQAQNCDWHQRTSYEAVSEDLPWALLLIDVTGHKLEDDAEHTQKVRQFYQDNEMEDLARIFDPEFTGYNPVITVPHLLAWWEQAGVYDATILCRP